MKTRTLNILIGINFAFAVLQAPLFYYYTFGLLVFFFIMPFVLVGLVMTIRLLILVINKAKSENIIFRLAVIIMTAVIGTLTLIYGDDYIEKADWKFRRETRNEIIGLVQENILKTDPKNGSICTLNKWNIPPISNGGNEITIDRGKAKEITVEFFINRGFLDHYSAFVFTTDPAKITELEDKVKTDKDKQDNKKLDSNWYRVSY